MIGTVDGLFLAAAETHPLRTFIRSDETASNTLSYADAAERVLTTAEHLHRLGLQSGDRVVVYATEIAPCASFHLSCAFAGVLPAPLPETASLAKVKEAIEDVQASALFALPGRLQEVKALGAPTHSMLVPPQHRPRSEVLDALRALARRHDTNAPYMLQPTSGTTGKSKYVVRPHAAFSRIAHVLGEQLAVEEQTPERILVIAALTHGMGQYLLSIACHLAAEMTIPQAIGTASSLEEIRRMDPTCLAMPPRVLRALLDQHLATGRSTADRIFGPSAKTIIVSGAASDASILRVLENQGIAVVEGYGASEFSVVAVTPRGEWREGHLGRILPDVELRVDEDGELLAKTPAMMKGYFGAPELTKAAFTKDGFYRCGDLCEITPDGWLRYLGRKRDVFNTSAGNNVHPARIEEMLEKLGWVHQAVLFGDQRPFLTALLTVEGIHGSAELGYLDPGEHRDAYERAAADLALLNDGLEADERILRFALFGQPIAEEHYAIVGHGKTRRDRGSIGRAYARFVEGLYGKSLGFEPALAQGS